MYIKATGPNQVSAIETREYKREVLDVHSAAPAGLNSAWSRLQAADIEQVALPALAFLSSFLNCLFFLSSALLPTAKHLQHFLSL